MPNENPTPRSFFAEIETVFLTLHIYGAAGIAAFGWAMGCFMGVPTVEWLPLWFCAALLIYNADRLRRDPADALNVPERTADSARLRTATGVTIALAVLVLIGLPVWRRDWLTLALIVAGGIVSLGYSIPILGFRWKDVPLIKSLVAPSVVVAAIFGLLVLGAAGHPVEGVAAESLADVFSVLRHVTFLLPWAWCYLLFNMLLCDLRDLAGDRRCGIRSVPVLVGKIGTRRLLGALTCGGLVILAAQCHFHRDEGVALGALALVTVPYQVWLTRATRRTRSERFYEWAVEGLLYLPALALVLAGVYCHRVPGDV